MIKGWAVKWRSGPDNIDHKRTEHLLTLAVWAGDKACHAQHTAFFKTRDAARQWAKTHYGYIARRGDLRKYPHDWRSPVVVRATLEVKEIENDDARHCSGQRKRHRRQTR